MHLLEVVLNEPDKERGSVGGRLLLPYQPTLYQPKAKGVAIYLLQLPPRQARLLVYNKRTNETSIWLVELRELHATVRSGHRRGKVLSSVVVPDVLPPMADSKSGGCGDEDAIKYAECEVVVKEYSPFVSAMKKRGIEDLDLVMVYSW